jgi:redox-sensitive bicupin YhaK (pirin superfamily)
MITLRKATERFDDRRGKQQTWLTFHAQASTEASPESFGGLTQLAEVRLPPGSTTRNRPQRNAELITYVLDGTLACEDSLGRTGLMHAGEFRRMTVGPGVSSNETNPSRANWTHLFKIGLGSGVRLPPAQEQKRFSVAQRRDGLCLVASAAARAGSIGIREDGLVYSALLRPGQHVVHDLREGRRAWLHVVSGEITLHDLVLTRGDGAGVSAERAASFTAVLESEVLLVDVA